MLTACGPPRPDHPVIGAKNFTEQVVLGELLAQEIEAKSNLKVERRFYLAGSYICQQALARRAHRWLRRIHRNRPHCHSQAAGRAES